MRTRSFLAAPLLAALIGCSSGGDPAPTPATPAAPAALIAPPTSSFFGSLQAGRFLITTGGNGNWTYKDIQHNTNAVSVQPGPNSPEGSQQTITAFPNAGFHVVWVGTDNDASASNTNTFHVSTGGAGQVIQVNFSL